MASVACRAICGEIIHNRWHLPGRATCPTVCPRHILGYLESIRILSDQQSRPFDQFIKSAKRQTDGNDNKILPTRMVYHFLSNKNFTASNAGTNPCMKWPTCRNYCVPSQISHLSYQITEPRHRCTGSHHQHDTVHKYPEVKQWSQRKRNACFGNYKRPMIAGSASNIHVSLSLGSMPDQIRTAKKIPSHR